MGVADATILKGRGATGSWYDALAAVFSFLCAPHEARVYNLDYGKMLSFTEVPAVILFLSLPLSHQCELTGAGSDVFSLLVTVGHCSIISVEVINTPVLELFFLHVTSS